MKDARKKIFLGWNGHQRYATKAVELFRERGYDTIYWIAADDAGIRIPGAIFHDKIKSSYGFPAESIDLSAYPPLDATFIRSLYKVESIALTMMDRLDTSVDEKKRLYHEMLRYWKGVLDTHTPDCIVFSCYPHHIGMFLLYSISRLRGIPTIFMHETFASYRLLSNSDYEKSPPLLASASARNEGISYTLDDLPDDLRALYERHRAGADTSPVYVKDLAQMYAVAERMRSALRIIVRSVADGSFFARTYTMIGRIFEYSLQKELRSVTTEPDLSVPFIYVPLHLQPEASTSPLGDIFADQTLMIEILSNALPEGWLLYVKENPYQFEWGKGRGWDAARYPGYYTKIGALKNARLVPLKTDTFTLIKHSKAVAAVTGTALFEALLRGKPALAFGYQWYAEMPGLFRVDGPQTTRDALALIREGFHPGEQQILAFLKSFGEASIRGVIDRLYPDEASGVTHEETVSRVVDFLSGQLDTLLR